MVEANTPHKHVTLDETNFEDFVINGEKPALVDFWASWCGPCQAIGPVIEELAGEYADTAVVGKVNVDENPELASRFGVQSIPTLLFFRMGEIVDTLVGAVPKPAIADKLKSVTTS